jgi:hypothetical protein
MRFALRLSVVATATLASMLVATPQAWAQG